MASRFKLITMWFHRNKNKLIWVFPPLSSPFSSLLFTTDNGKAFPQKLDDSSKKEFKRGQIIHKRNYKSLANYEQKKIVKYSSNEKTKSSWLFL